MTSRNSFSGTVRGCLISWAGFQLPRWQTVLHLREHYSVDFRVVAPPRAKCPTVYDASGYFSPSTVSLSDIPEFVTLVKLHDPNRPTSGFENSRLIAFLNEFDPDIVWIHGEPLDDLTLSLCKLFILRRRPRIYQAAVDNYQSLGCGGVLRKVERRFFLQRIDEFVVASESTALSVVRDLHVSRSRVHVVYAPNSRPAEQHRCLSRHDGFRIGFAGRLVEEKGIYVLLSALDLLPLEITLVTAGDGEENIRRRLTENCRVVHLGLLSSLDEFFSRINVLIVPSLTRPQWKEQFGRVIAEAFSRGVPVIGSDSGAIPDVVGDGGLIYSETSAEALAKMIMLVYEDRTLWDALGKAALERFNRCFSIEAYAQELASLFGLSRIVDSRVS